MITTHLILFGFFGGASGIADVEVNLDTINVELYFRDSIDRSLRFASADVAETLEFNASLNKQLLFAGDNISRTVNFDQNN